MEVDGAGEETRFVFVDADVSALPPAVPQRWSDDFVPLATADRITGRTPPLLSVSAFVKTYDMSIAAESEVDIPAMPSAPLPRTEAGEPSMSRSGLRGQPLWREGGRPRAFLTWCSTMPGPTS